MKRKMRGQQNDDIDPGVGTLIVIDFLKMNIYKICVSVVLTCTSK